MSTKIGLDFGTHQTKVCIVDYSDKRNRRYMFYRFKDLNGKERLTLPSVVQVNKDGTLSYGYTDERNALMVESSIPDNAPRKPKEPQFEKYSIFPEIPKPIRPSILDERISLRENVVYSFSELMNAIKKKNGTEGKSFKQRQEEARERYDNDQHIYVQKCLERESKAEQNRLSVDKKNDELRQKYIKDLQRYEKWMNENTKPKPQMYHYFKQAVFSSGMKWQHDESAMLVSIWYLTYVFFLLDKTYGTQNLIVSMGTSSSVSSWESNKRKATEIILTAYDLIERVYNHDMERFLSATVEELKNVTQIVPFSQKAKDENVIYVFPEAIANLQPLASRKAFAGGVNLLVDIGGGTTDISLFNAPHGDDVHVYDYQSLPFGINSIQEKGSEPHFTEVSRVVFEFTNKLERYASSIHVPTREVKKIANKRNVIFTGGGSADSKLTRPYQGFSEVIRFQERFFNLMSTNNIEEDVKEEIHVLSTALGLAMAKEDDSSIPMHTYVQLFEKVAEAYAYTDTRNGGEHYEHGLTDL